MNKTVSTIGLLIVFWGPPLLSIFYNQLNPSLGTGLGVPLGFLAGILLGASATLLVFIASRRWPSCRPQYLIVLGAAVVDLVLFPIANSGALSSVS